MSLDLTTVVIPYRHQSDHQERLFAWVLVEWRRAGVQVVVGADDPGGPFNLSRAVNRGIAQVRTPYAVVYGADHVPDPIRVAELPAEVENTGWLGVYAATAGLTELCTRMLVDQSSDGVALAVTAQAPFCTGIIAARTDVWRDVPMDERFHGWGSEDVAHRVALTTIYGTPQPGRGTLYAMWHEPASKEFFAANNVLLGEYLAAEGDVAGMRDVVSRGAPVTPWGDPLGGAL